MGDDACPVRGRIDDLASARLLGPGAAGREAVGTQDLTEDDGGFHHRESCAEAAADTGAEWQPICRPGGNIQKPLRPEDFRIGVLTGITVYRSDAWKNGVANRDTVAAQFDVLGEYSC